MQVPLRETAREGGVAILTAALAPSDTPVTLRYATRTGALLRVDGIPAGAFDREHHFAILPPSAATRTLEFAVELHALPTNGLPSGNGLNWWLLNTLANERPHTQADAEDAVAALPPAAGGTLAVIGHSHLDVAWLWSFEETRRKAARTFAIAVSLLDRDDTFVFAQGQPQLYAYVEADEPALFERVRELVSTRRFDPHIAAFWVESDCNLPSGESLLRQMLFAHRYMGERFGLTPTIAWLPDSFGFANTLPTLLAHAGIFRFATTKLSWNDTTPFPYAQFRWRGPDESEVTAALIRSYDGGVNEQRIAVARERNEPVVAGYGDGGGGVTEEMLRDVRREGRWVHPQTWFDDVDARRDALPVHRDELYLQYHRGVYTTHHGMKMHNALLERALEHAEELVSWCIAVKAPHPATERFREALDEAWEVTLRNQFHDVITGTSIQRVHDDAVDDYVAAEELVAGAITAAQQMLPRATRPRFAAKVCGPVKDGDAYVFDNGRIVARVRADGVIVELREGERNVVTRANLLAMYEDRPKKWDAWNIDAGYERSQRFAKAGEAAVTDGVLTISFALDGKSAAEMRIALHEHEPFLRVDLEVDWRSRHKLLRVENWLPLQSPAVTYGAPHGTIDRSTAFDTPELRAKFEIPGQRFALARDGDGCAVAMFALDSYGWNAKRLSKGGVQLGHSLLRSPQWPDPRGDEGMHRLSYAFSPVKSTSTGVVEHRWRRFAHDPRVRLFTTEDEALLTVACKPASNGDGVIVRVRECDGLARTAALRSGVRFASVECVDAIERPLPDARVEVAGESLQFDIGAFALRSFRVRF